MFAFVQDWGMRIVSDGSMFRGSTQNAGFPVGVLLNTNKHIFLRMTPRSGTEVFDVPNDFGQSFGEHRTPKTPPNIDVLGWGPWIYAWIADIP